MDIELTRIFVKIIQNGSFSKAAEILKVPKSTISKSLTRLEQETGTKLLLRTTRNLTLTAAGRLFYETCLGPIQTIEDAQRSLNGSDSILSGLIRITAPEDLGTEVIAPLIAELTKKHPLLNFELTYTDDRIDLIREGFDFAVRIGNLEASSLKAKRIGEITLIPISSPQYLKASEKIVDPKDLEKHQCLSLYGKASPKWKLKSKKGSFEVQVNPRIKSNQMTSLLKMVKARAGVALVPIFLCRQEIDQGKIIRILPEWLGPSLPVTLLSPVASTSSARHKLVGEALFNEIKKALSEVR
jgi:LysR family transcriptional regulator for bpeEF and oprC